MMIEGRANWSAYRAIERRRDLEAAVQNLVGPIPNINELPIDRLEALAGQNNVRFNRAAEHRGNGE